MPPEALVYLAKVRDAIRNDPTITSTPNSPMAASDLRCPKCNQPYYRLDLQVGDPGFGKVRCGCDDPLDPEAEFVKRLRASRLTFMEQYYTFARVHPKACRIKAKMAALKVLDKQGWLTLWGNYGSGKSYMGCAVVNEALARGQEPVYWLMPIFLEELKKAFHPITGPGASELYDQALRAPVLVIDEFEKINATPWALERLQTLFLQRYRQYDQQVTVWITNVEPVVGGGRDLVLIDERLFDVLDAMFSRMSQFAIVHMDDGDIRPAIGHKENS